MRLIARFGIIPAAIDMALFFTAFNRLQPLTAIEEANKNTASDVV